MNIYRENSTQKSAKIVAAATIWFINTENASSVLAEIPEHDALGATTLARQMFPSTTMVSLGETSLANAASPLPGTFYIGFYGALTVITSAELATARPHDLDDEWIGHDSNTTVFHLYTDPEQKLGGFACWEAGQLRRSFTAAGNEIIENSGVPFLFEHPFWSGERPQYFSSDAPSSTEGTAPPTVLPFHPQEFAETANRQWLGFRFTQPYFPGDTNPEDLKVSGFELHPASTPPPAVSSREEEIDSPPTVLADENAKKSHKGPLSRYFGFKK